MTAMDTALFGVVAVIAIDLVLLIALVGLKAVHHRRVISHDKRREEYVAVLSRHLAFEYHTDPINAEMARDAAFLDAVIDVRSTLVGPEVEKLLLIANRYGLVERQSARLRSRFPLGRRLRAAVSLAEMGDISSAAVLIEHLNDAEPEIRIQASRGLGRMDYTPAIDYILERLERETVWVRARFADTLIGYGQKAVWPLMAYVNVNQAAGDPAVVGDVIRVLGAIGDRDVGSQLASLLGNTTNKEVEIAVVAALGSLGTSLSIPPLLEELDSDDWRVRAQVVTALGGIGDPEVTAELSRTLSDSNWWVRRNSASALGDLPDGVAELYRALTFSDAFARDAAAEALADIGELARARAEFEKGAANQNQLRLIRYMRGEFATT